VINIDNIYPDVDARSATVLVDEDQQSLAIGKKGQNVRLASRLCGWEIEIKTRAEFEADQMAAVGGDAEEYSDDAMAPEVDDFDVPEAEAAQGADLVSELEPPGDSEASSVL
jgi:transcription antitermination factor NusA-like protein